MVLHGGQSTKRYPTVFHLLPPSIPSYKLTEDLQLNELNKNGEVRVTGKCARAPRVSSYPCMCRSRRPAAVIELGSQYCFHIN